MLRALAALALVAGIAFAPTALAGGGPETTVVVVNGDSPSSWRVANAYVAMRQIPSAHVCVIDGVPSLTVVDIETFRKRLWGPVKAFLDANRLVDVVDCVAWSADFPYGVDFAADKPAAYQGLTPVASLTSMTYLWRHVEAKDASRYLAPTVNGYYRRAPEERSPSREPTAEELDLRTRAQGLIIDRKWDDAEKAYARLLATYPEDYVSHYNRACCLARLSRLEEAMMALTASIDHGMFDSALMRDDADLTALRGRADFRALLARMETSARADVEPSSGFRSEYNWGRGDEPRNRYLLSTMLAYTGEWGNSVPEAVAALSSAAKSDGTNPKGTFYFLKNDDIRSKTREPRFEGAVEALRAMGRDAEILVKGKDGQDGNVPVGKDDVLGAMLGTASFQWASGKSRILPGAICEHLTSHGAEFRHGGQTKLSELIRAGAAGASGTVHEPYALQWKFPTPSIHVHYAAGCSLAEAFYQSVWGPYQLLIVGDPLARPFARFASVTRPAHAGTGPVIVAGSVAYAPEIVAADGTQSGVLELWIDGQPIGRATPGAKTATDSESLERGWHEVRAAVVEGSQIATRSGVADELWVADGANPTPPARPAPVRVGLDDVAVLSGRAPGAKSVELRVGSRVVANATVAGDGWKASVPAAHLGLGTTRAVPRAMRSDGSGSRGMPIDVVVGAPSVRKAVKPRPNVKDGLSCDVVLADGKKETFVLAHLGGAALDPVRKAIEQECKSPPKEIRVRGDFDAADGGLLQFVIGAAGEIAIDVDGKPALATRKVALDRLTFALVNLEAGWHALAIRYVPSGAPDLTVLLGGDRVTAPLAGKGVRQPVK